MQKVLLAVLSRGRRGERVCRSVILHKKINVVWIIEFEKKNLRFINPIKSIRLKLLDFKFKNQVVAD